MPDRRPLAGLLFRAEAASAAPLPRKVGTCAETTIDRIGYRLEGMPDSGSAVRYANGGVQVSYNTNGVR